MFTVGTIVMRCAGCALNDWADRDFDAHVKRTADRPLARVDIEPWEALVVAAAMAAVAFVLVAYGTNLQTVRLLRRRAGHRRRLSVLQALPRAAPGVSRHRVFLRHPDGVHRRCSAPSRCGAGCCSRANLFWVVAYDTEYAMVDRDDDIRLGLRTSAITFGRFDVVAVAVLLRACTSPDWPGSRSMRGMGRLFWAGFAVAVAFAVYHLWLIRTRERDRCFRAFLSNHWLGFAVFAGIALDYAVRLNAWPRLALTAGRSARTAAGR